LNNLLWGFGVVHLFFTINYTRSPNYLTQHSHFLLEDLIFFNKIKDLIAKYTPANWHEMTHQKLPFSALDTFLSGHLLDNPILMFSGENSVGQLTNTAHNVQLSESPNGSAVLAYSPKGYLSACCRTELDQVRQTFRESARMSITDESHGPTTANPEPPFRSGWAGFMSYDAGKTLQGLTPCTAALNSAGAPLAEFFYYPLSLYLDFADNSCTLQNPQRLPEAVTTAFIARLENAITAYKTATTLTAEMTKPRQWQCAWSKEQYQQAFTKTRHYLAAGDCYQVNLAMPFHCADDLRSISPAPLLQAFNAPFSAYLKPPAQTLFSVSPERFIRIDGDRIETRPIKGTIARGETAETDENNRQWLANSAKNRAENLMIVDLLRNDLSRSAEPFSVQVTKLFDIESHANVHHMVSTIVATRRPDQHAVDVIFDALPGGSITGAPKRRAMEVIDELEYQPRGAYCGVLGYFDDAGHADFNILIRTIAAAEQGATCWGGGGIVMDSTWEDEWQEIHSKVGRILSTPL